LVGAIDGAVKALGISKEFTGLVIVAIAGNAVENVVGITLAAKGQNDLAISVVKNSVAQIAVFLFPALVLLSLFFETRLTFVVPAVYIGALVLTALAGIVLGMGMPTTPSYIVMVSLLVPAVIKLGAIPPAAHMFGFHFANLPAIPPPVAPPRFAPGGGPLRVLGFGGAGVALGVQRPGLARRFGPRG